MNLTHVRAFTEAMTRKDLESMLLHMSEDVVLEPHSLPSRSEERLPSARSSALCWAWSIGLTSANSCRGLSMSPRSLRLPLDQMTWMGWTIGGSTTAA